jgi:hypothetical protein
LNTLPNLYYKFTDGANGEISRFAGYTTKVLTTIDIDNFDKIYSGYYNKKLKLKFRLFHGGLTSKTIKIKQIGFFGSKSFSLSGTNLYTRVSGEKTTGAAESNTVYNAFRLLLETYDDIDSADIDYGNLPTVRHNLMNYMCHVGRQLTERKNTADYIKELCEQSFVAAFQNRKGKIALSAWRDRTDTPHVHDNTTINRGTIGDWKLTGIDDVLNSFTVNYSRDPGGDKYFSAWQITDVDSGSGSPGGSLGALWDVCHGAWHIYKTVKEFKIDCSWFIDRARWYNAGEVGVGLGVDGSAYHWLENAVYWMTRQKRNVSYNIPLNATNVLVELCDPVHFRDPIYTNSLVETDYLDGAIEEIEYDILTDSIRVTPILQPNDTIDDDFGDIVETGSAADTITESGSQPDTISEDGT